MPARVRVKQDCGFPVCTWHLSGSSIPEPFAGSGTERQPPPRRVCTCAHAGGYRNGHGAAHRPGTGCGAASLHAREIKGETKVRTPRTATMVISLTGILLLGPELRCCWRASTYRRAVRSIVFEQVLQSGGRPFLETTVAGLLTLGLLIRFIGPLLATLPSFAAFCSAASG